MVVVSTPRILRMPPPVKPVMIHTSRGRFAALIATVADPGGQPGNGSSRPADSRERAGSGAPPGAGERRPALLVPGFTGSKEDFLAVLEPLASAGRTVIAIDMRGQFQSDRADGSLGYQLAELAEDVLAIARAVAESQQSQIHLLGHSFGGIVARQAVLTDRAAFCSLTLLGSGPGTIGGLRAQALAEFLEFLQPAGDNLDALNARILQIWEHQLGPQAVAEGTSPDVVEFLRSRIVGSCPVGLTAMARHLLDCPDLTADLAAVGALPKLVSYGEDDDAWPPAIQDLMAARLGAGRVRIPGAAHSPAVDAPQSTATALTQFWNAAEPSW